MLTLAHVNIGVIIFGVGNSQWCLHSKLIGWYWRIMKGNLSIDMPCSMCFNIFDLSRPQPSTHQQIANTVFYDFGPQLHCILIGNWWVLFFLLFFLLQLDPLVLNCRYKAKMLSWWLGCIARLRVAICHVPINTCIFMYNNVTFVVYSYQK